MRKITAFLIAFCMAALMAAGVAAAHEAPELITVEEPTLTENGEVLVDGIYYIPIDPTSIDITPEEIDDELEGILSGKEEDITDDEFVQSYSAENLRYKVNSVEELREYLQDELYHSKLQAAIIEVLIGQTQVESYPEEAFALLKEYAGQELEREAQMNLWAGLDDWDEERIVQDLGYASVEDFLNSEAMYYGKYVMLLDELADAYEITYDDEEVEQAIRDLMKFYGYEEDTTLEEYIELNGGDPWVFMVEKLNVEYHKVLSAMEENVVFESTDHEPGQTDETQASAEEDDNHFNDLKYYSAKTLDGETVSQDLINSKDLTILNIWATWCGFCIEEMPDLAGYAASLPEGVQMITFCTDGLDSPDLARQILQESGMADQDVTTIVSGTDDLENLLSKVIYLPTTFLLNSRGEIVGEPLVGSPDDLAAALDEMLALAQGKE